MRFASLGSGSRGNATLIEGGGVRVLVDCGFAVRELQRRLAELELTIADLDAVLVTHEHGDHIAGVGPLARRSGLPVWLSRGTLRGARDVDLPEIVHLRADVQASIGGLRLLPFAVPHDAAEACQFVFLADGARLGMLTDCGSLTGHIRDTLRGCDALVLECNYDPQMLRDGPYPPSLRQRVAGAYGHLSNDQAAQLLAALAGADAPRSLCLAHLSENNNHPEQALQAVQSVWRGERPPLVWRQDGVSDWVEVSADGRPGA